MWPVCRVRAAMQWPDAVHLPDPVRAAELPVREGLDMYPDNQRTAGRLVRGTGRRFECYRLQARLEASRQTAIDATPPQAQASIADDPHAQSGCQRLAMHLPTRFLISLFAETIRARRIYSTAYWYGSERSCRLEKIRLPFQAIASGRERSCAESYLPIVAGRLSATNGTMVS